MKHVKLPYSEAIGEVRLIEKRFKRILVRKKLTVWNWRELKILIKVTREYLKRHLKKADLYRALSKLNSIKEKCILLESAYGISPDCPFDKGQFDTWNEIIWDKTSRIKRK